MSLWTDIQPYLNKDTGLLQAPDSGTDNLVLFSAYLLRELYIELDAPAVLILKSRIAEFLSKNRIEEGLYSRKPGEDNSIDNLIGAAFCSSSVASDILTRWNNYQACFNCFKPEQRILGMFKNEGPFAQRFRYWFGRYVGIKAYLQVCSGEKPTLVQRFLWSVATIVSTFVEKGSSDPLIQSLQVEMMDTKGYCQLAVRIWNKKFKVSNLYAEYFGPTFPLTLYTEKHDNF